MSEKENKNISNNVKGKLDVLKKYIAIVGSVVVLYAGVTLAVESNAVKQTDQVNQSVTQTECIYDISDKVSNIDLVVSQLMITEQSDGTSIVTNYLTSCNELINEFSNIAQKNNVSDKEYEKFQTFQNSYLLFESSVKSLIESINNGDYVKSKMIYEEEYLVASQQTYEMLSGCKTLYVSNTNTTVSKYYSTTRIVSAITAIIAVIMIGVIIIGYKLLKSNLLKIEQTEHTLKKNEKVMNYLENKDLLTETYNRLALDDKLSIRRPLKDGESYALMMISVKDFADMHKYGTVFCDRFLGVFANKLQKIFPTGSEIFRTGSDEFTIFLKNVRENPIGNVYIRIPNYIRELVGETYKIGDTEIKPEYIIGVAEEHYRSGASSMEILDYACLAKKESKKSKQPNQINYINLDKKQMITIK